MSAKNRRNDGHAFERVIENILLQYQSRGIMRVKKVEQPIRYVGGRVINLANPFLDFVGTWTERNGRSIFFEVKSTINGSLRIGDGGLTDNQEDALHKWAAAGAVTFLLCDFVNLGEIRFWSQRAIDSRDRMIRNLPRESGRLVPQGQGFVIYDFHKLMSEEWR